MLLSLMYPGKLNAMCVGDLLNDNTTYLTSSLEKNNIDGVQ